MNYFKLNFSELWSEFLKFECAVGDLASILKVDKKRQKVFETVNFKERIKFSKLNFFQFLKRFKEYQN